MNDCSLILLPSNWSLESSTAGGKISLLSWRQNLSSLIFFLLFLRTLRFTASWLYLFFRFYWFIPTVKVCQSSMLAWLAFSARILSSTCINKHIKLGYTHIEGKQGEKERQRVHNKIHKEDNEGYINIIFILDVDESFDSFPQQRISICCCLVIVHWNYLRMLLKLNHSCIWLNKHWHNSIERPGSTSIDSSLLLLSLCHEP